MLFKKNLIHAIFIFTSLMPLAHGVDEVQVNHYVETVDTWPGVYYVLFGVAIAAIVLFIMSVMTGPDNLPL